MGDVFGVLGIATFFSSLHLVLIILMWILVLTLCLWNRSPCVLIVLVLGDRCWLWYRGGRCAGSLLDKSNSLVCVFCLSVETCSVDPPIVVLCTFSPSCRRLYGQIVCVWLTNLHSRVCWMNCWWSVGIMLIEFELLLYECIDSLPLGLVIVCCPLCSSVVGAKLSIHRFSAFYLYLQDWLYL